MIEQIKIDRQVPSKLVQMPRMQYTHFEKKNRLLQYHTFPYSANSISWYLTAL